MPGQRDPHPDDFADAILAASAVKYPEQFGAPGPTDKNLAAYGRTVVLKPVFTNVSNITGPLPWVTAVQTPQDFETAADWEIVVNWPLPLPAIGSPVMRITFTLGGVQFVKRPYIPQGGGIQRYHVTGQRVQVDFLWVDPSNTATGTISIDCGVGVTGNTDSPLDWYLGTTFDSGSGGTAGVLIDPMTFAGGGCLMSYQVILTTMSGDSQLYLQFFDQPTLASVTVGLGPPLWVSPPMTAAGQWYDFVQPNDEKLRYSKGLVAILSSSPYTYVAPTGTTPVADVRVQVGW
jgi:hypothetical protein